MKEARLKKHSQILFTRLCILFTRLQSDSTQSDSIYTTILEPDRTGPGAGRGVQRDLRKDILIAVEVVEVGT